MDVHHRFASVAGRRLFYREAAPTNAPAIVLLHGFPGPEGARAFRRDAATAEIYLLEGGHFLLETAVEQVAALIGEFLGRVTVSE